MVDEGISLHITINNLKSLTKKTQMPPHHYKEGGARRSEQASIYILAL